MQTNTIAIVADDPSVRHTICAPLGAAGYAVLEYDSRMLDSLSGGVDAVCLAIKDASGLQLLDALRDIDPDLPVVVSGPSELAGSAAEAGAYDFIVPTIDPSLISRVIAHAVEKRQLTLKLARLSTQLAGRQPAAGESESDSNEVVPLRELERQAIARALRATKGSVTKAAKLLGIGRATLYRRLASPDMASLRPRRGFEPSARVSAAGHTVLAAAGDSR